MAAPCRSRTAVGEWSSDVIDRALAEDLGAAASTSRPLRPSRPTLLGSADLVARQPGVRGRIARGRAAGPREGQRRTAEHRVRERRRRAGRRPGRGAGHRAGSGARSAHGRADRPEPARPPVRGRHPHPALGRRGGGHRRAVIRDTRKTTPGLRALEKYAVRMGGGVNHRMSLSDAAPGQGQPRRRGRRGRRRVRRWSAPPYPELPIEVEVDTVEQARAVIDAGADLVLLDNMSPDGHADGRRLRGTTRRPAGGVRRAHPRPGARGRRDRRRLPLGRRADALGRPCSTSGSISSRHP